jgi:hypothetical protein
MVAIYKETIPLIALSARLIELRDKGYMKGKFEIMQENKKFVELKVWRKRKKPVGRPRGFKIRTQEDADKVNDHIEKVFSGEERIKTLAETLISNYS